MIEDWREPPGRGEPGAGAAPSEPPHHSGWPSAGRPPSAEGQPTDVYAALSDLAPPDAFPPPATDPARPGSGWPEQDQPEHGQSVPRDFVPPQIAWTPQPEPDYFGGSQEQPEYFDGSRVHWTAAPENGRGPIERFEQRREGWRPDGLPPANWSLESGPRDGLPGRGPQDDGSLRRGWQDDGSLGRGRQDDSSLRHGWQDDGSRGSGPQGDGSQGRGPWDGSPGSGPQGHGSPGIRPPGDGPQIEWASAAETETFDGPLIDLSAPRPLPASHRGRRRTRSVVAVAAVGAVLAGTAGYLLLRGLGVGAKTQTDLSLPVITVSPSASSSVPVDAPADKLTSTPSASGRATSAAPRTSAPASAAASSTAASTRGSHQSLTVPVPPTGSATPPVGRPNATLAPSSSPAPLKAAFRLQPANGTGYLGTVVITNPGRTEVARWTVRMTAPGALQVIATGNGVTAVRDGDELVFAPAAGAAPIAAGGSLTFGFAVTGPLSAPPFGCEINGAPCF